MTGVYGEARTGHTHAGQDIAAPTGTAVRAAQCGTVTQAGADGSGYGNLVCIQHEGGVSTCYAHLSQINTTKGAYVHVGDVIGKVGCTGSCTGPHLHFEVRENGKAVNPEPYLAGSQDDPGKTAPAATTTVNARRRLAAKATAALAATTQGRHGDGRHRTATTASAPARPPRQRQPTRPPRRPRPRPGRDGPGRTGRRAAGRPRGRGAG